MYRGLDPSLPSVNIVYNYSTISKPSNWHCLQSRELIHIPLVTNALCVCVCVIDLCNFIWIGKHQHNEDRYVPSLEGFFVLPLCRHIYPIPNPWPLIWSPF